MSTFLEKQFDASARFFQRDSAKSLQCVSLSSALFAGSRCKSIRRLSPLDAIFPSGESANLVLSEMLGPIVVLPSNKISEKKVALRSVREANSNWTLPLGNCILSVHDGQNAIEFTSNTSWGRTVQVPVSFANAQAISFGQVTIGAKVACFEKCTIR